MTDDRPILIDAASCQGGATAGYRRAGFYVVAVDLDASALALNVHADLTVQADALDYLERFGHLADAVAASWPCQRWAANGVVKRKEWPDLITPGREIVQALGVPYVFENVPKAPLRRDLVLCGSMFDLTATDTDGTLLHLQRHRVFESNIALTSPAGFEGHPAAPCRGPKGKQWAGVYGGARTDKREAREVRRGGYTPPDPAVQSALLGGVPWMNGKGRRECIPPVYAEHIGRQLYAHVTN